MKITPLFALLIGISTSGLAQAELYRWVDENGKVHYGDRIPPEYAKTERQILDDSGTVKETLSREPTAEEHAEKIRREQEAEAAAARAEEQKRYDRYLLSTYPTVEDLSAARAYRLETLDGQIIASEKSIGDTQRVITELRERAAGLEAAGKPIPESLRKQIAQWENQLSKGERAAAVLRTDRENTANQFDTDIRRLRQLRSLRKADGKSG